MKSNAKSLNLSSAELIEELENSIVIFETRPAGFGLTIRDMLEKGYTESTARRMLLRAVDKLGWQKKQMRDSSSRIVWVYYK